MKRRIAVLSLATLSLAACVDDTPTAVAPQPADREQPSSYVAPFLPGRVIVRFASGRVNDRGPLSARSGEVRRMVEGHGARPERPMLLPRTWVLSVEPGTEEEVVRALNETPGVDWAEQDFLMPLIPCETGECADPEDFFLARKWDLHNTGSITLSGVTTPTGAVDADMDWIEAHDALGPAPAGTATIAIIDTGIRDTHLELAGRVVAAQNFASGYPATLIEDRDGHGTHVAGIAAAAGVSASGVAYGPGIRLINAKACELYLFPDGIVRTSCAVSSTADAIVYATDQGADVINLSLGGAPDATSGSAAQQAALQYARANDVLPFCATGNESYFQIAFPARFPECVAVSATNWADERASYSNYGPDTEISAPGGDGGDGFPLGLILSLSADADNLYTYMAGTSMATPQVVGLAALLFSQGVGDDDAVLARIKSTADDLGTPGDDEVFGAGRINVCRALNPANVRLLMSPLFSKRLRGLFPVVLYSDASQGGTAFDPEKLDEADLTLSDGSGTPAHVILTHGSHYLSALVDVDRDGDKDLVVAFDTRGMGVSANSGTIPFYVRGNVGCRRVEGRQNVRILR